MGNFKIIIILTSVFLGLSVIVLAYIISSTNYFGSNNDPLVRFSSEDLAQYDGKDGRNCYVAVNSVVYEINQGNKWEEGQHIPSEGLAYCGKDLTSVIDKSPHGKSILSILVEKGNIE